MIINQAKMAVYATYLTNYFGLQLMFTSDSKDKKRIRTEYCKTLLEKLNIEVIVKNPERIPPQGQYLLLCNHRSIIDPLIVEVATENTGFMGHWISKKELYDSFFFGTFVRNAGTILVDREAKEMSGFFADIKKRVQAGDSIYVFPEGTRNTGEETLGEFQGGARIIAIKNRLPMLPVYIRTHADDALKTSLECDGTIKQTIELEVGNLIDYKDKTPLQESFKKQFALN